MDSFQLPSACTCHHNSLIGERIFKNRTDNTQPKITSPVCDTNGLSRGAPRIANLLSPKKQIQLCKKSRPKRRGKSDNTVVFFPGTSNRGCQLLQPKECANNSDICDDASDYPEDIVSQSIQRLSGKVKDLYLKVTYFQN